MAKPNGKTQTHFEQIALATVERTAIADVPDDRDRQRRVNDEIQEPEATFQTRRAVDRRKSTDVPPSSPSKES